MTNHKIDYKPSLIARIAKVLIPILKFLLPKKFYKITYDFLYNLYKKTLRLLYFLRFSWHYIFGNHLTKCKMKLTHKLLPYTMGGSRALENAFDIVLKVEVKKLDGAIVECGVAEGGTSAMMAMTNKKFSSVKRIKWLFDSYEGLPEPTEEDYKGNKTGDFIRPLTKGACLGTIDQVSELMFEKLKFSKDEVHLVKGWFQDTLPIMKFKIGKIAVLRLDGDWYESTKVPLENLFDQVAVGGFVIIDDYATCYGSKKAVDEFIEDKGLKIVLNADGRGGAWFEKIS